MSDFLAIIKELACNGEVKISEHGYDELADDGIVVRDIVSGLPGEKYLKTILDIARDHVFLFLSMIQMESLFTQCGEYQKANLVRRCL